MRDKKILVNTGDGMNDTFSAIAYNINYAYINNIKFSNIYVTHPLYKNLDTFLHFKDINYISHVKTFNNYDIVYSKGCGASTLLNYNTPLGLNNFLHLSNYILEKTKDIENSIGVHFRFMCYDRNHFLFEEIHQTVEKYTKSFLEIYDSSKKYFVCSSSPVLNDFLKKFKNIIYIPKTYVASKPVNRRKYIEDIFFDIAALSRCNTIYRTEGNFTKCAKILSTHNINIITL